MYEKDQIGGGGGICGGGGGGPPVNPGGGMGGMGGGGMPWKHISQQQQRDCQLSGKRNQEGMKGNTSMTLPGAPRWCQRAFSGNVW